jgi:hypothetical protein
LLELFQGPLLGFQPEESLLELLELFQGPLLGFQPELPWPVGAPWP